VHSTLESTGVLRLTNAVFSVPVELTSALRFLYFITVFGGVGFEVHTGKSTLDAELDGDMTAEVELPNGQRETVDLGRASVQVQETAGPTAGSLRLLAGLQVNVSV
jgi:hypothetical protein